MGVRVPGKGDRVPGRSVRVLDRGVLEYLGGGGGEGLKCLKHFPETVMASQF